MHAARRDRPDTPAASPFLKWAGGKTQLLEHILPRLPERMRTYYEPFIGGGAVFFRLAQQGRFERAVIADRNPQLVEAYRVVQSEVDALIEALSKHANHATDSDYFYALRALDSKQMDPVERVARLLFLNRTCFNGLYRLNRKGKFNVPFGKYKNPRVLNEPKLRAAATALKKVTILESDFEAVAKKAKAGDAVYFDPPYVPISTSASFTAYDGNPFGDAEHERLNGLYRKLCAGGVKAILSNSDCDYTRKLYRGLKIETVYATRNINSKGKKRGAITEVLVVGARPARKILAAQNDSAVPAARARRMKKVG